MAKITTGEYLTFFWGKVCLRKWHINRDKNEMRMELYNIDCGSVFNQKEMQIQRHFLAFVSEDKNQRKVFCKNQCLPYENSSEFSLVCSIRTFLRTISYIYKMVGWHHWLDAHEFEQTLGDSERQKSLACCSTWCHRVGHNWETEQQYYIYVCIIYYAFV